MNYIKATIILMTLIAACASTSKNNNQADTGFADSDTSTDSGSDTHTDSTTDGNVDMSIMRGTPMVFAKSDWYRSSTEFASKLSNWQMLKTDFHLNTVRACWIGPHIRDHEPSQPVWSPQDAEFLTVMDTLVENARLAGMNIIINYHNVGEQNDGDSPETTGSDLGYTFADVRAFWDVIAPRYKDEDHVYYELANEPTFVASDYLDTTFRENLVSVYESVRAAAPDREILMFSFNNVDVNVPGIVAAYEEFLDWDHTTIAWHGYFGANGTDVGTSAIEAIIDTGYKNVCTEMDYFGRRTDFTWVKSINGSAFPPRAFEALDVGWIDWRDWDQFDTYGEATVWLNKLKADAMANGYAWMPVDTIEDTETSQPERVDSLLTNGDFENGTEGWYQESATIEASSIAHGGTGAVLVSGRTAEWGAARQDVTSLAEQNGHAQNYEVSAWVRLAEGAEPARVRISVYVEDSGDVQYQGQYNNTAQLDLTEEYQLVTGTYFIDWDVGEQLRKVHFYVDTTTSTSDMIIDDCEMKLVP